MVMVLEVNLVVNGKPIPPPSPELLPTYLGLCRDLLGHIPSGSRVSTESATSALPEQTIFEEKAGERKDEQSVRTWLEQAWLNLNRPATAEDIYRAATQQGYVSGSKNPVSITVRRLREHPRFSLQGRNEKGKQLWVMTNSPSEVSSVAAEDQPQEKPANWRKQPRIPPVGERTIDYAVRVLKEAGRGMPIEELTSAMLQAGWYSESPTPRKRNQSALVALRHHKDKLAKSGNLWDLVERQQG